MNHPSTKSAFYTKGQFVDFCKDVFCSGRSGGPMRQGVDNIEVVCPICKILKEQQRPGAYTKNKLAIQTKEHKVHCWVCGYKSRNLYHLLQRYKPDFLKRYVENFLSAEDLNKIIEKNNEKLGIKNKEAVPERKVELPEDFVLLATGDKNNDWCVRDARNYLKARGADSIDTLWYWRLGVSRDDRKLSRRVIVPSFDARGDLNFYSARTWIPNAFPKYENPFADRENLVFNEINIDWKSELVLVEGVFDLIKCVENATAVLGSDLPGHFQLFQKIVENKTPVALALDPDAEKSTFRIATRLHEFDVPVRIVEIDQTKFKDVGDMSKPEFEEALHNAKTFNVDYMLRTKIRKILD